MLFDGANKRFVYSPANSSQSSTIDIGSKVNVPNSGDVLLTSAGIYMSEDKGLTADTWVRHFSVAGEMLERVQVHRGAVRLSETRSGQVTATNSTDGFASIVTNAAGALLAPDQQLDVRSDGSLNSSKKGTRIITRFSDLHTLVVAEERNGVLGRAWRIHSSSVIGSLGLAETTSSGDAAIVVGVTNDDFKAPASVDSYVQLGTAGLTAAFDIDNNEYAESRWYGRYRLVDGDLYHLATTSGGASVGAYVVP